MGTLWEGSGSSHPSADSTMILLYFCPRTLKILLSWHLSYVFQTASHTRNQHKSLLSDHIVSFGFKNVTVDQLWGDKRKQNSSSDFWGEPGLRGLVHLRIGGQDSGWHEDMENCGSRAGASKDRGPGKPGTGTSWVFNQEHSLIFPQPWQ